MERRAGRRRIGGAELPHGEGFPLDVGVDVDARIREQTSIDVIHQRRLEVFDPAQRFGQRLGRILS